MCYDFIVKQIKGLLKAAVLLLAVQATSARAEVLAGNSLLYARLPAGAQNEAEFLRVTQAGMQPAEDIGVPLGSVWKLFVYAYAWDEKLAMPAYQCSGGKHTREEVYCCNPGETVMQDAALAQSCGLFFAPERLHIDSSAWQRYWQNKAPRAPWLSDLQSMQPQQQVKVSSLLQALASIEPSVREHIQTVLLAVVLKGRGQSALGYLGGQYRVKTFTWEHIQRADSVMGGAAGWLADGSAVWFGALGSSASVMREYAAQLGRLAAPHTANALQGRCVEVRMFGNYPFRAIRRLPEGERVQAGALRELHGQYEAEFKNGNKISFSSKGEMRVEWKHGQPQLMARLDENEYVARVIEREADANVQQAARALGVVARSYLLQHADKQGACLLIDDSSRAQRVSASPAGPAAREAAAFGAGLVLQNVVAQYRLESEMKNVLSWKRAVAQAKQGKQYDEILRLAFESGSLSNESGVSDCEALPDAGKWLAKQVPRWRGKLQMEPGYAEVAFKVCRLNYGKPYTDLAKRRIYVRGLYSLNERITLAHEYLHLAFAGYPSGQDENYVEQWARRLIEGESAL